MKTNCHVIEELTRYPVSLNYSMTLHQQNAVHGRGLFARKSCKDKTEASKQQYSMSGYGRHGNGRHKAQINAISIV
jgi:hypothetical protein